MAKRLERLEEENNQLKRQQDNNFNVKYSKIKNELHHLKYENEQLSKKIVTQANLNLFDFLNKR